MPGVYTSVMRGVHNQTGDGVIETFDLQGPDTQLYIAAAGTRGKVLQGDGALISGVILIGYAPITMLIRTLGPSLTQAGLPGALPDPYLYLVNANGETIAANDNWFDNPAKDAIIATGLAPADDLEPALLISLFPATYTAVATGFAGDTGLAFTQVYSLAFPPWELDPAPKVRGR
ncbi:MAG: hypothetical protein ABI233_02080 [Chthoniobacterales bacterium]